jgi:hypothetical protein
MKNLQTFDEFVNESKMNESIVGALGLVTLYGLFSVGQWAYKTAKYWLSKPGRYFKKLEKDPVFFEQFIELLKEYNPDPLKALRRFTISERKDFVSKLFNVPRAVELKIELGLTNIDIWTVESDFEDAVIGNEKGSPVYKFIETKLKNK